MEAAQQLSTAIHAQHPERPAPPVTALARYSTDVQVIPTSTGNQLVVHRPLFLPERMVALAAAISIDYGESCPRLNVSICHGYIIVMAPRALFPCRLFLPALDERRRVPVTIHGAPDPALPG